MDSKKILIITYYWPPAGGPGVQRWLKFAKYLPHFGWKPIIYTPENPSYPLIDESLTKEIPENLEIVKTPIWEPYQIAEKLNRNNKKFKSGQFDVGKNQTWKSKLSIWIRGNFFIPDARKFWVKPSVKFLKKYLRENNIKTIVTSGPPHSMHLIGLHLKKEFPELFWIADFRDPWTEISYYKHLKLSSRSDKKHRDLENQVFRTADITLATSFTDAENFSKNGANSICITNGFDEDDRNIENNVYRNSKFTLSYIGVLEQLRNPEILWKILVEIIESDNNFKQDFELKFVGKIDDKILESLENSALKTCINNIGYVEHYKAVHEMQNSNILLITNFPETSSKGIIPGKLFEYLASGKQILSFGPVDADVAKILHEANAGKHFGYYDESNVKKFINDHYHNWKSDVQVSKETNIDQFSRKQLTQKLVTLLDKKTNS